MNIDLHDLWPMIVRGARIAYNLDSPSLPPRSFEESLARCVPATREQGRSDVIDHLELLCGRAVKGESHTPLNQQSSEDQRAVAVAFEALQAVRELELMAAMECELKDS